MAIVIAGTPTQAAVAAGSNAARPKTAPRAAEAKGWQQSLSFEPPLISVSCASSLDCVAVGGSGLPTSTPAMFTTDGGSTWSTASTPESVGALESVSCVAFGLCVAVGTTAENPDIEATLEGGFPVPSAPAPLVVVSTDDGAKWSLADLPSALASPSYEHPSLSEASCADDGFCMVVGSARVPGSSSEPLVLVSSGGGTGWVLEPEPSVIDDFSSLACLAPATCFATGVPREPGPPGKGNGGTAVVVETSDGGSAWSLLVTSESPETIACSSASDCTLVGATVSATTDGGTSWTNVGNGLGSAFGYLLSGPPASLSCPTSDFCVAGVGAGLAVTTDGGSSWSLPALPPQASFVSSVSCPSASNCTAVGSSGSGALVMATTDGGQSWSAEDTAASTYGLVGSSCASSATCMVVGGSTVEATSNGGSSWQTLGLPSSQPEGAAYLRAVSCGSPASCVAVGSTQPSSGLPGASAIIDVGSPGGSAMNPVAVPSNVADLVAVSCYGSTTCVALGQSPQGSPVILESSDGGKSWSSVPVPSGVTKVVSVSCASAADCLTLATTASTASQYYFGPPGVVLSTNDGGASWTSIGPLALSSGNSPKLPSVLHPESISCPTPVECVATVSNFSGIVYSTDGGHTWLAGTESEASSINKSGLGFLAQLSSATVVSCSTASDCVAAGSFGLTWRSDDGGATWNPEILLPIGYSSYYLPGQGAGYPYLGQSASQIGLSCTSPSECVLASGQSAYATSDGGVVPPSAPGDVHAVGAPGSALVTWSPAPIDGGAPITSYLVTSSPPGANVTVPATATHALVPGLKDGTSYTFSVEAVNLAGAGAASSPSNQTVPSRGGYWALGADGGVYAFGDAGYFGSLPGDHVVPGASIVGMAPTPDGDGYWLADAKGDVYAFGDAKPYGSLPAEKLQPFGPVVGIVATPDGGGYWLVTSEGYVYTFGDATFVGPVDPGNLGISDVVGMAPTPDGGGYWLVGADGGVYAFGDAGYFGSLPGDHVVPAEPVVGIAPTPDGGGYWLVGADGGVYAFGDAGYFGSLPGDHVVPGASIVGMAPTPDGGGYWLVGADGGVYAFGDAGYFGSLPGDHVVPAEPVVGIAALP